MATRLPPDDEDAPVRAPVGGDEEEVAELLVALRRQIEATDRLISQTGGLLREIEGHQTGQTPRRAPKS